MGAKYWIRTNEKRFFPLETIEFTDYYVNSWFEYARLRISKRNKLIFIQKYYNN